MEESSPPAWVRSLSTGTVGLVCGLLAIAVLVLPSWVAPLYDPPGAPLSARATEWLSWARDYASGAKTSEPAAPAAPATNVWRSPRIKVVGLLLAFVALVCAAIAFVRREDPRAVACTVALGAGAVASSSLVTAMMVLVIALTAAVLAAVMRRA